MGHPTFVRTRVRALPRLDSRRAAWIALLTLLVAAAVFLLHETRGNTLWFDEWQWALDRRGNDLATFLDPHNEHLSLVPIVIYRVLFATAGLGDYAPYRILVIAAHLLCVGLLFVYASRRLGSLAALLPTVLILFLGPGSQNFIWPFQLGWLISLAGGLGGLLMLDRGDRGGDVGASVLLAASLASSGIGVVFALGAGVELSRGRWRRRGWIVAAPLAVYAVWWLAYQNADFVRHNVVVTPGFVADAAAGATSALVGLAGDMVAHRDAPLAWGRPLAVVAALAVAWRLARLRPIPPRVLALLTIVLSFWVLTGLRRAHLTTPVESRYLY